MRFALEGEMPPYLLAKDLILHIIGEITVSGERCVWRTERNKKCGCTGAGVVAAAQPASSSEGTAAPTGRAVSRSLPAGVVML